jgi:hypothetical protein
VVAPQAGQRGIEEFRNTGAGAGSRPVIGAWPASVYRSSCGRRSEEPPLTVRIRRCHTTAGAVLGKPRRSRANLRAPSRSASVIDRLLKNQNPLENRNNIRPSSPHLVLGKRPGAAPQFCGPKFTDTGAKLFRSPMLGSGIFRRLDGEALGGPPPREDPAQARHALAGGFDNCTTGSSKRSRCCLQPGMTPVPITFLRPQNRGAVIQGSIGRGSASG